MSLKYHKKTPQRYIVLGCHQFLRQNYLYFIITAIALQIFQAVAPAHPFCNL